MENPYLDLAQPCYCLSDPESGRLLYASPAARALRSAASGGIPDELPGSMPTYAWQLFDSDPAFAHTYQGARLNGAGSVPLALRDRAGASSLLFSKLVHIEGKTLRRDVLILLDKAEKRELNAAALMEKYAADLTPDSPAPPAPDEVRVNMFGGFALETAKGCMSGADISSRQSCLLLIYLLCNRGRVAPVYELAEALWPEQLLDNPYNMVKNVAFRLRRHVAPICDKPLIVAYHGTYILNPELRFVVDCDFFDTLLHQYYRGASGDPEALSAALRLYRGSLLPGFDTELWLIARTQYYQNAYRKAVLDYAGLLRRQGDFMALYSLLREASSVCPWEPSLHVAMVQALAQDKGPDAARRYLQQAGPLLSQPELRLISRQLEQLGKSSGEKP